MTEDVFIKQLIKLLTQKANEAEQLRDATGNNANE